MDDRQRQLRIERMKREKQRQLARRKRQQILMRRCLTVGAAVAVVLVVISLMWIAIKPIVKKAGVDKSVENTTVEVQAGANNETPEVIDAEGNSQQQDEATPTDGTEIQNTDTQNTDSQNTESTQLADTAAVKEPIREGTTVNYSVPGWQVDGTGWWYADADNTYYKSGWITLDDQRYYFNHQGYMQTGWAAIGSKGCYFSETGVYEPNKESKMIAMTFDDGPGPYTADLLNILEENGAKATFFMLGQRIDEEGGKNIEKMKALGCELGNHSYSHPNLMNMDTDQIKEQFKRTDDLIAQYASGDVATVARTPFGAQDSDVTMAVNKPCIYWNLDTEDWSTRDVESDIESVLNNVSDGDIVLMHDIWPETVESCKTIIPKLIEQGYQLVTVSELAQAKGVQMEDGVTYYDFTEATLNKTNQEDSSEDNNDDSEEIYDDYEDN